MRYFVSIPLYIMVFFLILGVIRPLEIKAESASIKVKKDWFIVNGERFLIKGIGYSNCRPHEQPNTKRIDLEQERKEFAIIKAAGFNTLRTWKPMTLEELKLANEFGLYVIQGMWIEYQQNFTDPERVTQIVEQLKPIVKESSQAPNVLMYVVGNEPQPAQVFSVGHKNTNDFFKLLRDQIKQQAPHAVVTMSNWVQSDFLDDYMWDVAAFNIYIYNPESVNHAMGYRGYVNWLKNTRAPKRPLINTEMGLSTSKGGIGLWGYGGNSEVEQQEGVLYMYREAFNGGATGACVFEWIDEWWKNFNHGSDWDVHEPADPEEWFGICYYDENGELQKKPVYSALQEFNQAICVTPKDSEKVSKSSPVEIYTEEDIKEVSVSVGINQDWDWIPLKRASPHWFTGKLNVKKMPDGKTELRIKAKAKTNMEYVKKQVIYIDNARKMDEPYQVSVSLSEHVVYTNNRTTPIKLMFDVTNAKKKKVAGETVTFSIYEPVLNQKLKLSKITDKNGRVEHVYLLNEEGVLTVAAGVVAYPSEAKGVTDTTYLVKSGDCKHVYIYYEKEGGKR
ncbi:MAG: hypothetical protein JW774_00435 [Candidatus Aureabacteria bacterium]|nr:hypothetical protein [Candidatus Auribacterota bacterium]